MIFKVSVSIDVPELVRLHLEILRVNDVSVVFIISLCNLLDESVVSAEVWESAVHAHPSTASNYQGICFLNECGRSLDQGGISVWPIHEFVIIN